MEKVKVEERLLAESKEIFKYLDKSIYDKIPDDIKELVNSYDGDYVFTYDASKSLNEQAIAQETKDFIVALYYHFAADEEGKKKVIENINKYEESLKAQQKPLEELFKEKKEEEKKDNIESTEKESQALVVQKESIINKIINKIKNIFRKG